MQADERNKYGKEIQTKWKSIRDHFTKELRGMKHSASGDIAKKKKKYVFFDELLFLIPIIEGRPTSSNLSDTRHEVLSTEGETEEVQQESPFDVTLLNIVPPLAVFLAKDSRVAKYDLSSVRQINCGAAPLGRNIQEQVESIVSNSRSKIGAPPCRLHQGYGLTETTLGVTMSPPESKKYGSIGTLHPGIQGKVVDLETGKALGPHKEGELCFRGPMIMKGYLGNPEATAATIDKDGWLLTGDVGYYDEDGYFYIVDRLKELIKYKGYQVAPAELEALLLMHPAIEDAAVIGIPDEVAGELPMAFVVKQPGMDLTDAEVVKYVEDRVSRQKRLRGGVRFVKSIPKTASGKILRRVLRDAAKSKL